MTTNLLTQCGEALYGTRWRTDLAAALDVDERTVRRWVSGDTPVPRGVYTDLMRIMQERALDLDKLTDECKRYG